MRNAVTLLNLPFAKGAFIDSFEDQHEKLCLPGTQKQLLQQVQPGWHMSWEIKWLLGT